ncbi:tyrosine-type recombinase/integrase [Niabella insulamsoli]|uniref:tyrosine-type recombinase/integrase n=1 Tax=Niabella insulamsoli TaxID=3144874 RepID=UPI0031FC5F92
MKRKNQIRLPNGCWCSPLTVHPKNWEKGGEKSLKEKWYISYRFYDPKRVDKQGNLIPKQVILKGMNELFTHRERTKATKMIIESELTILVEQGFNPITQEFKPDTEYEAILSPSTRLYKALAKSAETIDVAPTTRAEVKGVVKYATKSIFSLKLTGLEVGETRIKHIRAILDNCANIKEVWNNNQFNVYRKCLNMLFVELIEQGAIEHNPAREIKKRKWTERLKAGIPSYERRRIDEHLRKKKLTSFRLFIRILFSTGARITELMDVQRNVVDLANQTYVVTIKKGKSYKQVKKTITNHSLRYWKLLCKTAQPNDYIFSEGLVPGSKKIRTDQIKRRWATHVQSEKYGINTKHTIYELKHTHTTEVVTNNSDEHAAALNSHSSLKLVHSVYDRLHDQRKHEELKKVRVSFI